MFTLKVQNDKGQALNLTDDPRYIVYKIDGLAPPQANINSSVNTTADGSSINSVRLQDRNIVLYISIEGDVETNRIALYSYFPIKKTVTLYFSNGSRDVSIDGTIETIECDLFSNKQTAQISIVCPKPYFKDTTTIVTRFSEITSLFEFPFSIGEWGIAFSEYTPIVRKDIINNSDVETGTIIELFATGTVVNPVIYDVQKRTHISLLFTMQPSDLIVINTNHGEKSINLVRDGVTTNILGNMSKDSTWFTLSSGDNVFTYTAENGDIDLQITFYTNVLYSGV